MNGRYVRIQCVEPTVYNNENYVHVAQIIAYDENGKRIPVTGGSVINPYYPDKPDAGKLWDNRRDTIGHTDNSPKAYVEIDLGRSYKVSKVTVWNRKVCCDGRIVGTQLLVIDQDESTTATFAFTVSKPEFNILLSQGSAGSREQQ